MKEKLYQSLKKNKINIDKDVFDYGWNVMVQYLIYFIILLPFVIYKSMYIELIVFLLIFTPLRRYLGGYHFNKKSLCTFFSVIITVIILYASKTWYHGEIKIYSMFFIIYFLIVFIIGPVDHKNKRITVKEYNRFKLYAIILLILFSMIFCVMYLNSFYVCSNLIFLTITFSILNLVIGKIFQR